MRFNYLSGLFLLILIGLQLTKAGAQRFGGNPPALKWRQINTETVRVIFPEALTDKAAEVASIADALHKNDDPYSLGSKIKKVNIVLQNQTTISNGYVGLGPFRSEFYLTPLQNSFRLGSIPWHQQLAIHEYRHVQQYNNFNVGISKLIGNLFGEQGRAVANGLVVPDWFFEGDAVFNETYISNQGRGRLPYFYNGYRSLWKAGHNYRWMKLRNGSLKDYIPDHYPLGYMLVTYGYESYGADFWKKVTRDAASYKGLFYPFQKAVKRYSGKTYVQFRNQALRYFRDTLFPVVPSGIEENTEWQKQEVTDEEYPAYINDSSIVFVRTAYNKIPVFMIRQGSMQRKIRTKDISLDNYFSYKNNKIVYASYRPDIRWGFKDYSLINVLDITTGLQRTLTHQSKYFSPDINKECTKVMAVYTGADGTNRLHILDASDGKLLQVVPDSSGFFYTYPKFYKDHILLSPVRNTEGRMSLALIHSMSGQKEFLLPFSFNVIGFPVIQQDTVYFTASYKGEDRLFAIEIKSRQLFRLNVTPGGMGAYQPTTTAKNIAFSSFTAKGFKIATEPASLTAFETDSLLTIDDVVLENINAEKAGLLNQISTGTYTSESYSKNIRLFNFHSLEPYFTDPDYRLSLVGENILNTLQSELFVNYNRNEQYKQAGFNATYGALFPYISAGASYTIDRNGLTSNNQRIYWNESRARAGLSLPLNLSKGRTNTYLNTSASYVFNNLSYKGAFKNLGSFSFGYLSSTISFTNQIQQARQHIYPRLAQSLLIDYSRALHNIEANQLLFSGNLYFPGLSQNHNLVLNGAYQKRDTLGEYSFSNGLPFSKGYQAVNLRTMFKWGVNYHLPLFYPDAGIGQVLYFLRIRANLFYDHTIGEVAYTNGLRLDTDFRSAGTELFFDTRWWNQFPVTVGFRYSYLLDRDLFGSAGVNRFEFILPVNLFR